MSSAQPVSYRPPVEITFTFPAELQQELGYKTVTIRELLPSIEAKAITRAGNDGGVLVQEMVKESIVRAVAIDGTVREISTGDESIDRFMTEVGPKGRTMLMAAYNRVNQPGVAETKGFLDSATAVSR